MNRRRLLALSMFATPLVVVGVACTFPDVTFGPSTGAEGGPGNGSEGGADGGNDVVTLPDGSSIGDVAVRDDASAIVDANACATKPVCDCDEDGYLDQNCDAGADATAPGKKPGDCDDLDPLRHPNAGYTEAEPVGHDGDWDCNQKVDHFPPQNLKCGGGATGCTGGSGFVGAPACGTKAEYYSCEYQGGLLGGCAPKASGTQITQACK